MNSYNTPSNVKKKSSEHKKAIKELIKRTTP